MTDFADHNEALIRLQTELETLAAGRETIAQYGKLTKSVLDSAHNMSATNQELAARISGSVEQMDQLLATLERDFQSLQSVIGDTADRYQVVLSQLKELDVATRLEGLEAQEAVVNMALSELRQQLNTGADKLLSEIRGQQQWTIEAEKQVSDRDRKMHDRLNLIENRLQDGQRKGTEQLSSELRQSSTDHLNQLQRLSDTVGEIQRVQYVLKKDIDNQRQAVRQNKIFLLIGIGAQVGGLVLLLLLLVLLALRYNPI